MNTKVAVGPSTVLGAGVSTSAFVAAVLAFLFGDHSQQTLGTIVGGALSGTVLVVTLAGRYLQAHAALTNAAPGALNEDVPGLTEGVKADSPVEGTDG